MTTITNPGGDGDESIERAARVLRSSKQNTEVFRAIYTGSKRFKTIDAIRPSITKFNTNTYKAAARLYGENIVERKTVEGVVFYGKKDFYVHNRDRILNLARNAGRL